MYFIKNCLGWIADELENDGECPCCLSAGDATHAPPSASDPSRCLRRLSHNSTLSYVSQTGLCNFQLHANLLHLLFGRKNLFLFQTISLISCYSISPMLFLELKSLPHPSIPLLIIANTGTLPWTVHAV